MRIDRMAAPPGGYPGTSYTEIGAARRYPATRSHVVGGFTAGIS